MNDGNAKQQIVEHIKNANNILVSVSTNPTVDSLSAALSMALMLNKMEKQATAVFSGVIPPAISFLQPEKTFEGTVSSLRDFIIALDKDKASRLRTKVEDDVVRVFVTPYHTTITEKDLQFSQGDFNVDLVIALGVDSKNTLDQAIVAHGRILHDAAVVTINANDQRSSLGSVDWHDPNASSLCEMLMALSEALQPGLIDEPTATALLTGIVAATERFANRHTTPKVMTMSAQLMAAGANQQLIATKLEEGEELPAAVSHDEAPIDLKKVPPAPAKAKAEVEPEPKKADDGEMRIDHTAAPAPSINLPSPAPATEAVADAEAALEEALAANGTPATPAGNDLSHALEQEAAEQQASHAPQGRQTLAAPPQPDEEPKPESKPSWKSGRLEPPRMGGTLNAIGEEALEEKLRQEERERNLGLLNHNAPRTPVEEPAPEPVPEPPAPLRIDSLAVNYEEAPLPLPQAQAAPAALPELPSLEPPQADEPASAADRPPTLAELEAEAHAKTAQQLAQPVENVATDIDQAREAVSDAFNGPLPSQAPIAAPPVPQSPPQPPMPPMPDFSTLPPLPPQPFEAPQPGQHLPPPAEDIYPSEQPPASSPAPNPPADPGQFRIPGQ